ncbi:cysteine desulfurase family protein [soil metagenome]
MPFLDHAATTPLDPRVAALLVQLQSAPLNASSVHQHGQRARAILEEARSITGECLRIDPKNIVFTASATEANNLAIRGVAARVRAMLRRPIRILTSNLEHACVRETIADLQRREAAEATLMGVDEDGCAKLPEVKPLDAPDLLCLMAVQNETGIIQQLKVAREFCGFMGAHWLCDITQAVGVMDCGHDQIGAHLYSLSSHKIYGPCGVGVLAGELVPHLTPQITGGPQENNRRAGTQPVALIRAFAEALQLATAERDERASHLQQLVARTEEKLRAANVPFRISGDPARRAPGFLNLCIDNLTGPDLVIALDARGFSISSGAACSTGVMEISPAMAAMFPSDEPRAAAAVRITPGKETTIQQIDDLVNAIAAISSLGTRIS